MIIVNLNIDEVTFKLENLKSRTKSVRKSDNFIYSVKRITYHVIFIHSKLDLGIQNKEISSLNKKL